VITEIFKTSSPDEFTRRYILPKRIVWQSDNITPSESMNRLLKENSMQASTYDLPYFFLKNNNEKKAGILFDFGCELNGGIRITVNNTLAQKPVRLRIRFGESVSEAMGEPDNDHAIHNFIASVPCLGAAEFGNTGFRFVRIDLIDNNTFIEIKQICAVFVFRDLEYKGHFECSDARLNKIWKTGAYTVHLNMQEYLWDGIKRDRLVWLGDMHPEVMTINYVFGQNEIVPRSLDFVRDNAPLPKWINGIPSYSLWWLIVQKDWFLYHGDIEYLNSQKEYILGLLEQLYKHIGINNNETLPEMRFLDWPTSNDKLTLDAGLQSMMILAFKAGAWLCRYLQEYTAEHKCLEAAQRLLSYNVKAAHTKQAISMMTLAGLLDAQKANEDFLGKEPNSGLSPFFGYYVLLARSLAKDYEGALNVIRNYWGAMIDLGATTFWEGFDIAWKDSARIDNIVPECKKDFHREFGEYCYKGLRHSLCHGWASGPTAWLAENVLGFHPLEPGSKKLLIKPELADLDWAKGVFPTPYGPIAVNHSKDKNGKIQTIIDKPKGVEVVKHETFNNQRTETFVS
jgi:hypothetical protein